MNRKYEALIVLDTKGKEETVDSLVSTISKDMEKAGLKLEQIDVIEPGHVCLPMEKVSHWI